MCGRVASQARVVLIIIAIAFCFQGIACEPWYKNLAAQVLQKGSRVGGLHRYLVEAMSSEKSATEIAPLLRPWLSSLGAWNRARLSEILPDLKIHTIAEFKILQRAVNGATETSGIKTLRFHYDAARNISVETVPAKYVAKAIPSLKGMNNPFATAFYLGEAESTRQTHLIKFRQLLDMKQSTGTSNWFEKISNWTESPHHALYLYEHIADFGERAPEVLSYLLKNNEHFQSSDSVKGVKKTLVTYSYEKETRSSKLADYYKDPKMTDEEWFEIPADERLQRLRTLNGGVEREFRPANVIAPTKRKPSSLGGFSHEWVYMFTDLLEVAHRSYEINPDFMVDQMIEVAGHFKEHSFHAHVVFDLPHGYKKFGGFEQWFKQINDYLFLKGLERRLHTSDMVRLPRLAPNKLFSNFELQGLIGRSDYVPTRLGQLRQQNYKFFEAGLRAGLYGSSKKFNHQKVGIELRQTNKDVEEWRGWLKQIGASAGTRIWETEFDGPLKHLHLDFHPRKDIDRLAGAGISRRSAARMLQAVPQLAIALNKYEEAQFRDYQDGMMMMANKTGKFYILEARDHFISNLKAIANRIEQIPEGEKALTFKEITSKTRGLLSDWATESQVSFLYSGF